MFESFRRRKIVYSSLVKSVDDVRVSLEVTIPSIWEKIIVKRPRILKNKFFRSFKSIFAKFLKDLYVLIIVCKIILI